MLLPSALDTALARARLSHLNHARKGRAKPPQLRRVGRARSTSPDVLQIIKKLLFIKAAPRWCLSGVQCRSNVYPRSNHRFSKSSRLISVMPLAVERGTPAPSGSSPHGGLISSDFFRFLRVYKADCGIRLLIRIYVSRRLR
jgi:hypothetical protein